MQNRITGDSSEDALEIVLKKSVHLREVLLNQLVLEGAMDMQLQTLLGPGGELCLLGTGIVGELDTLVNCWEVDQGVEKTDPMKATFKYILLINIL